MSNGPPVIRADLVVYLKSMFGTKPTTEPVYDLALVNMRAGQDVIILHLASLLAKQESIGEQ